MHSSEATVSVLVLVSVLWCSITTEAANRKSSPCSGLASYRLTLETFWSKEDFPKQYPLYRPPAQWSKLIGRTHSDDYSMWTLNKTIGAALKEFVERSSTSKLDTETQGSNGVYDVFVAPNINSGVGKTQVTIYAESKHSKVSTISLMIPSPDWYVGVNDLELCDSTGRWTEIIVKDLHPMDAGVDRGLTFSAPKWAENSPVPVIQITSKQPSHPAASFYYPELENLKPIGRLTLEREAVSEERIVRVESKRMTHEIPTYRTAHAGGFRYHEYDLKSNSKVEVKDQRGSQNFSPETEDVKTLREQERLDRERKHDMKQQRQHRKQHRQQDRQRQKSNIGTALPKQTEEKLKTEEQVTPSQSALQGNGARVNCEVGPWTDWSECSKTCGYGTKTRTRPMLRAPQHGGTACPLLTEQTICGSMRGCEWNHFSHMNWN